MMMKNAMHTTHKHRMDDNNEVAMRKEAKVSKMMCICPDAMRLTL
jgi:hypothetical protein